MDPVAHKRIDMNSIPFQTCAPMHSGNPLDLYLFRTKLPSQLMCHFLRAIWFLAICFNSRGILCGRRWVIKYLRHWISRLRPVRCFYCGICYVAFRRSVNSTIRVPIAQEVSKTLFRFHMMFTQIIIDELYATDQFQSMRAWKTNFTDLTMLIEYTRLMNVNHIFGLEIKHDTQTYG